jgi:hypothetical protein
MLIVNVLDIFKNKKFANSLFYLYEIKQLLNNFLGI